MQLFWIDADDLAVFDVHFLNYICILTPVTRKKEVVVKLAPAMSVVSR
jgi:hypothetical protein